MRAGLFKDEIGLYEKVVNSSEYGETTITYEQVRRVKAKVDYNSGSRTIENNEIFYPITRTFTIHHYVKLDESCRILYGGNYYQITSIEPVPEKNEKIIIASLVNE